MRNPRVWRRFWILLLTPASLLVLKGARGCPLAPDSGSGDPDAPIHDVTVTLQNLEAPIIGQAVHLFAGTETFPCCRLEPGESRTVVYRMRNGAHLDFEAGRDGNTLATRRCGCGSACPTDPTAPTGSPKVEWNGSSLACRGW